MAERNGSGIDYSALRLLAVENPKRAREAFCELLAGNPETLHQILREASAPGEGRLRQLIANAVRLSPDKKKIADQLLQWQSVETDEFARRAIDAAIDGLESPARGRVHRRRQTLVSPELAQVYRYVASRIRHQTNNALMEPAGLLADLGDQVARIRDEGLSGVMMSTVSQLGDALERIERIIGFNPDDAYFAVRSVEVLGWLQSMNLEYSRRYKPVNLVITGDTASRPLRIVASDYWLQTVFWNLWINAQQAVGDPCVIEVRVKCAGDTLQLTILDNGDGFPKQSRDALPEGFSTKGVGRGRGLLEIQDAVEQLQGEVCFVDFEGHIRVRISFNLEQL